MNKLPDNNNGFSLISVLKKEWYILLLILATFLIGLYFYPDLPAKVPTHWNIRGEIDGWSTKTFAVWFFPLLNLGIYFMMLLLPRIDPRRDNYKRFEGPYNLIRLALHIFFAFVYLLSLYAAFGHEVKVDILVKSSMSLLFIILGNYMAKIKHNYFVGIKTPWTLASEEVWTKTHRFAGPFWVSAGVLGLALSFVRATWAGYLFFGAIMIMVFIPMIYSYIIFKRVS